MHDIYKIEQLAAASWPSYIQKEWEMASQSEFWRNQTGEQRMDIGGHARRRLPKRDRAFL